MVGPPLDADVVTAGPVLLGPDAFSEQKTVSTSLTSETSPKPFKGPQLMWNEGSTTIEPQQVRPAQPVAGDDAEEDALPLIVPRTKRRSTDSE
jgi:hypothetical protein